MRSQLVLTVDEGGERLDRFVASHLGGRSRTEIQRWILAGEVTVGGEVVKSSYRLSQGNVVRVRLPEEKPLQLLPWDIPLSIIYEDEDCLVVEKPAGMVVHPATSHRQDTLVNALLAHYPEIAAMADPTTEQGRRPGIVHRLDKDTSGLVVVARHVAARLDLQRQFRQRAVEKVYRALVHGQMQPTRGVIAACVGRDPRHRQRMAVVPDGRKASTIYKVQRFLFTPYGTHESFTLVEARPVTGRTHQIRIHFAHIGHPIVGDRVYGPRKRRIACPRQFLHAWRLGYHRPSDGQWVVFTSQLPEDLRLVLSGLEEIT